jgi:hypothetical protein
MCVQNSVDGRLQCESLAVANKKAADFRADRTTCRVTPVGAARYGHGRHRRTLCGHDMASAPTRRRLLCDFKCTSVSSV